MLNTHRLGTDIIYTNSDTRLGKYLHLHALNYELLDDDNLYLKLFYIRISEDPCTAKQAFPSVSAFPSLVELVNTKSSR